LANRDGNGDDPANRDANANGSANCDGHDPADGDTYPAPHGLADRLADCYGHT